MMPGLRNIQIILAYDGSGYHGWQIQEGAATIQETVEKALAGILEHEVRVTASGRTDAGVHALGQVISFQTSTAIPEQGLLRAMNSTLPPDIAVLKVREVGMDFHARYSASAKSYVYVMEASEVMSPFLFRYALHHPWRLDTEAMDRAARTIEGEHDFTSFMGAGSGVKTTRRRVMESRIFTRGSKVVFFIRGSGFLRHMVRNIVGTLIPIGQGKMPPGDMERILMLKDRTKAGPTAPPQGLYLVGVEYGPEGQASPDDE
jgi:tRNA pseudouridine38-40 synthase